MTNGNGIQNRMTKEEFKALNGDQKLDILYSALYDLQDLNTRFAGKWVENWMKTIAGVILIGFISTLMISIGWHPDLGGSTPPTTLP